MGFWSKWWNDEDDGETDLTVQAAKADKILNKLGLPKHTESGRQMREAVALELLSSEYESIKGYKMGAFVNQVGDQTIAKIMGLLAQEGVFTRRKIENKKNPQENKS